MGNLEYVLYYDKDNIKHKTIFQESIPIFNEQARAMSLISNVSAATDIDKENLIFRLKITSGFNFVADTIIGEFINHGSLGKATISQLFVFAAIGLTEELKKEKDNSFDMDKYI